MPHWLYATLSDHYIWYWFAAQEPCRSLRLGSLQVSQSPARNRRKLSTWQCVAGISQSQRNGNRLDGPDWWRHQCSQWTSCPTASCCWCKACWCNPNWLELDFLAPALRAVCKRSSNYGIYQTSQTVRDASMRQQRENPWNGTHARMRKFNQYSHELACSWKVQMQHTCSNLRYALQIRSCNAAFESVHFLSRMMPSSGTSET